MDSFDYEANYKPKTDLLKALTILTSTIVMVSLLRKLIPDPDYRRFVVAVVVIAANLGLWDGQELETLSNFYANSKIVLPPPTHGVIFHPCMVNELEWQLNMKEGFSASKKKH
ncbi:hypothetical protein SUGI_0524240 [Cryptomeria japonica]|nr:hypothetical protein SUGI_0524240 [Cryptomeria japonica]